MNLLFRLRCNRIRCGTPLQFGDENLHLRDRAAVNDIETIHVPVNDNPPPPQPNRSNPTPIPAITRHIRNHLAPIRPVFLTSPNQPEAEVSVSDL
jgi:hypothetical protein